MGLVESGKVPREELTYARIRMKMLKYVVNVFQHIILSILPTLLGAGPRPGPQCGSGPCLGRPPCHRFDASALVPGPRV